MSTRSLRATLLLWLIVPLLGLWLASSLAAILIVRHAAESMYDEELLDTALSIDHFLHSADRSHELDTVAAELQALIFDPVDEVRYAVLDAHGDVVSGSRNAPTPPALLVPGSPTYFDVSAGDQPMRWVAVQSTRAAVTPPPVIVVGETLRKREAAIHQALLYVAAPQLLLAAGLAVLVWFGIGRGLRPLRELQERLRLRSASDLKPLHLADPPEEVRAVTNEINDLLSRLSALLAQQSAFIGDAAHQLRTPLAALKASVEYAQRHHGTADAQRSLNDVAATADRCIHVVTQLLGLARAEAAHSGGIALQPLDLDAVCVEIVTERVNGAFARQIDLGIEGASGAVVAGDPTLLREALGNLVDNAVSYSPPGGNVTVRARVEDGVARVAVTDAGPGVAPAERERIFERFQRGDTAEGTGTGLGLPVARRCAQAMGGGVVLLDLPASAGTTFVLELRLAPA